MKATRFEYRYQTLLHLLLVGLALLTYFFDPVDIVWGLVQSHPDGRLLERIVFGAGAVELLISAALETWAKAQPPIAAASQGRYAPYQLRLARMLLASAVGLLLPLFGALALVAGEAILVSRLFLRDRESAASFTHRPRSQARFLRDGVSWRPAFRAAAAKWGLAASMSVFALTLQDRIAEIGAALSVVVWLVLNVPAHVRSDA